MLAALTGSPVVTVPVGFSQPDNNAPIGVPIGMEILGRKWDEMRLLGIAAAIERLTKVRRMPKFAEAIVEVRGGAYDSVPEVRPDRGNINVAYPLGVY